MLHLEAALWGDLRGEVVGINVIGIDTGQK